VAAGFSFVMPGLVPGIHAFPMARGSKTWMAGTYARRRASRFSPAMTRKITDMS